MASKCPACGAKLRLYDVKAECKHCGANIPNYNWEARLEEDNRIAEEKFAALYKTLNILKYSVYGTKLRIWRIAMSFLPAIGFILPWARLNGLNFDLLGLFSKGISTLDFFGYLFSNIGAVLSAITGAQPHGLHFLGFFMMLLSIVSIVAAFFLIFIRFKRPKTKAVVIADVISLLFAVAAAVMFNLSASRVAGLDFSLGTLQFNNSTAEACWGIYVYIALLCVAFIGNLLVARADIKSEETLEQERLEKVRIKEEKEEQNRIKKEAARAEAKKKAEAEQAEKVRKAREALAANENKK